MLTLLTTLVLIAEPTEYALALESLAKFRKNAQGTVFTDKALNATLDPKVYEVLVFNRSKDKIVVKAVPTGRYPPLADDVAVIGKDHKDFGPLSKELDKLHMK